MFRLREQVQHSGILEVSQSERPVLLFFLLFFTCFGGNRNNQLWRDACLARQGRRARARAATSGGCGSDPNLAHNSVRCSSHVASMRQASGLYVGQRCGCSKTMQDAQARIIRRHAPAKQRHSLQMQNEGSTWSRDCGGSLRCRLVMWSVCSSLLWGRAASGGAPISLELASCPPSHRPASAGSGLLAHWDLLVWPEQYRRTRLSSNMPSKGAAHKSRKRFLELQQWKLTPFWVSGPLVREPQYHRAVSVVRCRSFGSKRQALDSARGDPAAALRGNHLRA